MLRVLPPMFELSRKKSVCFRNGEKLHRADLDSWSSKWRTRETQAPLIFRPNWGLKGRKKILFETSPPSPLHLSQGLDDQAPPLSEGLDPPLRHILDRSLCQNVPTITKSFHLDKWNLTIRYSADKLVFESSRCRRRRRCQGGGFRSSSPWDKGAVSKKFFRHLGLSLV